MKRAIVALVKVLALVTFDLAVLAAIMCMATWG